jgi:hypothetical protein
VTTVKAGEVDSPIKLLVYDVLNAERHFAEPPENVKQLFEQLFFSRRG